MVSNSKVIYLQKEDGRSIKAYVVSFLLDQTTGKTYVIVANQNGKNAKGYEVVENQAVILSSEESTIFKGYKSNPNFLDITNEFEDGISLELVKEAKKEETVEVVYYVYDNNSLSAYRATLSTSNVLSNIHFLKNWEKVREADIARVVNENQYPEPAFVIYDKVNDLEYGKDGTVTPLKWVAVSDIPYESRPDIYDEAIEDFLDAAEPIQDENSGPSLIENELSDEPVNEPLQEEITDIVIDGKPIVFYVYDQNVVKKYSALLTHETEDEIEIKDVKTIEVITGATNLDIKRFLAGEEVAIGSYFVNYDDYNPTIENINGKLIAVATLNNAICKTEEMAKQAFEEDHEPIIQINEELTSKKILVFNGDIDVYDNQTHYTIWGCFCTILSEEPLTIVPDKNGVKTIIYEDEKSSSINEVCQKYQNLYPGISVYLTGAEIKGSNEIILNEYTCFEPQPEKNEGTLLESGRKVLTEEEMIAKREKELADLKKNNRY